MKKNKRIKDPKEVLEGVSENKLDANPNQKDPKAIPDADSGKPNYSFKKASNEAKVIEPIIQSEEDPSQRNLRVNSVGGANTMKAKLTFGGLANQLDGGESLVPEGKERRSEDRPGKKLDAVSRFINDQPAEKVITKGQYPETLSESADKVQGVITNFRPDHVKATRNAGRAPSQVDFSRSIDLITNDKAYFTDGQIIYHNPNEVDEMTPTKTVSNEATGSVEDIDLGRRSNYLPRFLKLKLNSNGELVKFVFDVDDLSSYSSDLERGSQRKINLLNIIETVRMEMDNKAGSETDAGWTPLARAVREPSKTISYLRDIDLMTGNTVYYALRALKKQLAYQVNKAAKDGPTKGEDIWDMHIGSILNISDAYYSDGGPSPYDSGEKFLSNPDIFTENLYKIGCPSVMLDAFDSKRKYSTKGDFLNQPRSYKSWLQAGESNCSTLYADSDFIKLIENSDAFSTLDGSYNPLQPILATDGVALIYPYDFNKLYSYNNATERSNFKHLRIGYKDRNSQYVTTIMFPLLKGIERWIESHSGQFLKVWGTNEITIPINYQLTAISLWPIIVAGAVQDIQRTRAFSLRELIDYTDNFEYPYPNAIRLDSVDIHYSANYKMGQIGDPIQVGKLHPSILHEWILPELFLPVKESLDSYHFLLPWYINEAEFETTTAGKVTHTGDYAMTVMSFRLGWLPKTYELFYGTMSNRDLRLSIDRIVDVSLLGDNGELEANVYKYEYKSDGLVLAKIHETKFTAKNLMSLPRELGYKMILPAGVAKPLPQIMNLAPDAVKLGYITLNDTVVGKSSFEMTRWASKITHVYEPSGVGYPKLFALDRPDDSRGSLYVQYPIKYAAMYNYTNKTFTKGFVLSLSDLLNPDLTLNDYAKIIPVIGFDTKENEWAKKDFNFEVFTTQFYFFTAYSFFPFDINPFSLSSRLVVAGQDGLMVDPLDKLTCLGLIGLHASEYNEDVVNRINKKYNAGFGFISDPFKDDSPIFQ